MEVHEESATPRATSREPQATRKALACFQHQIQPTSWCNPESHCRTSKVATISHGTMEDLFILAAATSIVSTILPITSAEPALFGVYAVDLLSRWRPLRGFRKTLEDDHDQRPWRLMEDIWVQLFDREGPLGHKRPACMLLFACLRGGLFYSLPLRERGRSSSLVQSS